MNTPIYTPMPSEAFILGALFTLIVIVIFWAVLRWIRMALLLSELDKRLTQAVPDGFDDLIDPSPRKTEPDK